MEDKKHNVISLEYELYVNGKLIEKTDTSHPFSFLTGTGCVLPRFEENIIQSNINEHFSFELTAEEAYGPVRPEAIVKVPAERLQPDGQTIVKGMNIGDSIPMQDSQGNHLTGVIREIGNDFVLMDFNHSLAGNALRFNGRILHIREATEDEIVHGHLHDQHNCDDCSDPDCHSRAHD
jgi:FKBP-type peptidyl-prolyl cis-trans isomerase SlyD